MTLTQIIRSELYKNLCRRSSYLLAVPALLALLVTAGFRFGVIQISLNGSDVSAYSCMDYVFLLWSLLSGLGIFGILFLLFSSFQFSGELERGQIKFLLLRSDSRARVLAGKYLSCLIVCAAALLITLAASVIGYYLLLSSSPMGTGSFAPAAAGLDLPRILLYLLLQAVSCLFWISAAFLIGLWAGPFVCFVLSAVVMYAGNYAASGDNLFARLFPSGLGARLLAGNSPAFAEWILSGLFTLAALCVILIVAARKFSALDIK